MMKRHQRGFGLGRYSWFVTIFLLLIWNSSAQAQSQIGSDQSAPSRNPVRTIRVGTARFDYYENPAVAASSTFYLSGSQTNSLVFDYIGVTVAFANRGTSLRQPSAVNFQFVVATYRDGCKVRDKYANGDKSNVRVVIIADAVSLFEKDLPLTAVNVTQTRKGKMCMEMYWFALPFETLTKLASARNASFSIGPRTLGFRRKHLDSLKVILDGIGHY